MVHLNHLIKHKLLLAFLAGSSLFTTSSNAGVIQFFNLPNDLNQSLKTELNLFIANDPVSIDAFLHKWHGKYTPNDSKNLAMLDSRVDIGGFINDYYVGYFYQYNVFIDTNRDFTDLFYNIKNKNDLISGRDYNLNLDIKGIRQHGLMLAKSVDIYKDKSSEIRFLGGFYLSYAKHMQEGFIKGSARTNSPKDYDIDASSSYYYTHNYLYKLDTDASHGFGYGMHLGLTYEDRKNSWGLKFLVNDFLSSVLWKDLPYSKISILTKNKTYDDQGYTQYSPTINGLEKYKDYTQKLDTSYKLEATKKIDNFHLRGGIDSKYSDFFPYVNLGYVFDDSKLLEVSYESRFGSFGVGYHSEYFNINLSADDFTDVSAFGLSSSFIFRF